MNMDVPESMKEPLAAWNSGGGIDLESWVACEGSFSLAVGYASVFWPAFVVHGEYVFRQGFSQDSLSGFEREYRGDRRAIEAVMNHLHISDLQHYGCEDLTLVKVLVLGETLRDVYETKLARDFPDRPCRVIFEKPEMIDDLESYQISFWQIKHETKTR